MKTNVHDSIAMFDLYKAKKIAILCWFSCQSFENIMRQAGNYNLPIARFAKGNNSIFIFKLKIKHCIFPLFNMAINLINVVAFDLMLWSREPTHYLVLWARQVIQCTCINDIMVIHVCDVQSLMLY